MTQNIIVAPNLILFGSVRMSMTECSKVAITVSSVWDIPWLLLQLDIFLALTLPVSGGCLLWWHDARSWWLLQSAVACCLDALPKPGASTSTTNSQLGWGLGCFLAMAGPQHHYLRATSYIPVQCGMGHHLVGTKMALRRRTDCELKVAVSVAERLWCTFWSSWYHQWPATGQRHSMPCIPTP